MNTLKHLQQSGIPIGKRMLQTLIDTCVWRHWFTFKQSPDKLSPTLLAHSENFQTIYQIASSSTQVELLYNALVEYELGDRYCTELSRYVLPIARKIVIPLSRRDGLYRRDGSILRRGLMDAELRPYLTADGYDQEAMIAKAAQSLQADEKLYDTSPRKRELDIEHMESALEARADLFITNDKIIIDRLSKMSSRYDSSNPINMICSITRAPTSALPQVKSYIEA